MSEIIPLAAEEIEIANAYIGVGFSVSMAAAELGVAKHIITATINKAPVKRYIDTVFADTGYRNRARIADVLDEMIESKLLEAKETEMYTKADLLDLLKFAHQTQLDHEKISAKGSPAPVMKLQQNNFGGDSSNYGALMGKLLEHDSGD